MMVGINLFYTQAKLYVYFFTIQINDIITKTTYHSYLNPRYSFKPKKIDGLSNQILTFKFQCK